MKNLIVIALLVISATMSAQTPVTISGKIDSVFRVSKNASGTSAVVCFTSNGKLFRQGINSTIAATAKLGDSIIVTREFGKSDIVRLFKKTKAK